MFYIDSNKCISCGACVDVCTQRAISIQNDVAVINQRLCSQCGDCVAICPADAIRAVAPIYVELRKGDGKMRGRGWFARGYRGWGRGNPYPFGCFYPWLPRRWWAYGPAPYPQITPAYYPTYTPYQWG